MFKAAAAIVVAIAVVTLCAACDALSRPTIITSPDGLRTFPAPAGPAQCTTIAALEPVHGTLHGERGASDQAWLETADSRHLSVVWPQGFSIRLEPVFQLIDEQGRVAAQQGEEVTLPQIPTSSASGSFADPYFATGTLFSGCYPRRFSSRDRAA